MMHVYYSHTHIAVSPQKKHHATQSSSRVCLCVRVWHGSYVYMLYYYYISRAAAGKRSSARRMRKPRDVLKIETLNLSKSDFFFSEFAIFFGWLYTHIFMYMCVYMPQARGCVCDDMYLNATRSSIIVWIGKYKLYDIRTGYTVLY